MLWNIAEVFRPLQGTRQDKSLLLITWPASTCHETLIMTAVPLLYSGIHI